MPQNRSFGRFALGLLVAPLAGAATSFILAYVFAFAAGTPAERTPSGGWHIAIFVAWWTFLICLAYTIVVGSAAYAYVTLRRRRLSAIFAMIAGLVVGAPFVFIFLSRESDMLSGKSLFFPALAVICSLVTAWTFWAVALSSFAVEGLAQDEPRLA
jgi:amino acid permease